MTPSVEWLLCVLLNQMSYLEKSSQHRKKKLPQHEQNLFLLATLITSSTWFSELIANRKTFIIIYIEFSLLHMKSGSIINDQFKRIHQSISKTIIAGTDWPVQDKFTFHSMRSNWPQCCAASFLMLSNTWMVMIFPTISFRDSLQLVWLTFSQFL